MPEIDSALIDEYGTNCTPIIENLDGFIAPVLDAVQRWGEGTCSITAHEWAFLRVYLHRAATFRTGDPAISGLVPHGMNSQHLLQALTLGHQLVQLRDAWLARYPGLRDFEYDYITWYIGNAVDCVSAQVQIRLAINLYKVEREKLREIGDY